MTTQLKEVPIGIQIIQKSVDKCCPRRRINRVLWYRGSVLFLTYISYMCYHMSRKSISVVKNVLNQDCSKLPHPDNVPRNITHWCDWAPFNGSDSSELLGTLDSAFLFAYAVAMFLSGFVAERVNLRYFLAFGMIFSGIFSYLFGIARSYNIHSMWYFIVVQILGGVSQTTGWPGVVTVVGNWFGEGKRGLIFGVWNSHTSLGNILGSLVAGAFVEDDWGMSFIVPGVIIALTGFLVFLFLVVSPGDVGCSSPEHLHSRMVVRNGYRRLEAHLPQNCDSSDGFSSDDSGILGGTDETEDLAANNEDTPILLINSPSEKAIGFLGALRIPGVIEFSLSLFFSKLVNYTFLYWLPLYIKYSTSLSPALAAALSTLFDIGGIVGAIVAGVMSDYSGMSATTCAVMLVLAAPMLFVYEAFGTTSLAINIILLLIVGLLVNGPYALITTSVSAELGTHSSLEGNSKALATVTAIIDGTGSIGAAVGPLLAGIVSPHGWRLVFYMLIASDFVALLLLSRLVVSEVRKLRAARLVSRVL